MYAEVTLNLFKFIFCQKGTPGVGKSSLSRQLAERTELVWRDVSKLAVENKCLNEYDDKYKCPVLNEKALLKSMNAYMKKGGNIVDYHGADLFPEHWFDMVFVLRTDNTILYDRLAARGYKGIKLEDNITCEIFQTILEEAKTAYREEIIQELRSDNETQMNENLNRICDWLEAWKKDNS